MDKYQQLKIAASILNETMKEVCEQADVSLTTIKGVCDGSVTSARLEGFISKKIHQADQAYQEHRKKNIGGKTKRGITVSG